jgi:hypothetical protein
MWLDDRPLLDDAIVGALRAMRGSVDTVEMEVAHVDRDWVQGYIEPNSSQIRYLAAKYAIITGTRAMQPPTIWRDAVGDLHFVDGDGTFAVLRDAGIKHMPFCVLR